MKFLIGSQALNIHLGLKDRIASDWDILCEEKPSYIPENTEIYLKNHLTDKTNLEIFNYCQNISSSLKKIMTPIGESFVAPLEILKVLKISSENELNKFKHELDLRTYLKDIDLSAKLLDLAQRRKLEIQTRVSLQKQYFFNKYKVERYIDHDEIHYEINKNPAFLKAIKKDGTTLSPNKFKKLSLQEKIDIVQEEVFVLAMERFFIFNYKKNPASLYSLCQSFQETKDSAKPMLFWLQKMAIKGSLKDHPDWLALWVNENYLTILNNMDIWWEKSFHSISCEFWKKIIK